MHAAPSPPLPCPVAAAWTPYRARRGVLTGYARRNHPRRYGGPFGWSFSSSAVAHGSRLFGLAVICMRGVQKCEKPRNAESLEMRKAPKNAGEPKSTRSPEMQKARKSGKPQNAGSPEMRKAQKCEKAQTCGKPRNAKRPEMRKALKYGEPRNAGSLEMRNAQLEMQKAQKGGKPGNMGSPEIREV